MFHVKIFENAKLVKTQFSEGKYLDAWETSTELQRDVISVLRQMQNMFGLNVMSINPEYDQMLTADLENAFLELEGLCCPECKDEPKVGNVDSGETKIDPVIIITIIQVVAKLIEQILANRRK